MTSIPSSQNSTSSSQKSQSNLVQELVELGKQAFDPSLSSTSRDAGKSKYDEFTRRTQTWVLLPALNTLIKPGVLPQWLSQAFMQTLTLVPLRPDGVRATMEFVFSVHPTSSAQSPDSASSQKQGASITHEAVAVATRLLSSVPASMTPEAWFGGISSQIFHLIDGNDGQDLSRTASQIVGFGILGRKQLGAPGAPGWETFAQPLLNDINPSLRKSSGTESRQEAEIIDLSQDTVLTSSSSLDISLRRLKMLVLSNSSPGLCRRLLKPILTQIWILASRPSHSDGENPSATASAALLKTYLKLFGNSDTVSLLIQRVLCKGSDPGEKIPWVYRTSATGAVDVVIQRLGTSRESETSWSEIDEKSSLLAEMIDTSCLDQDVSSIFLGLLQDWIKTTGDTTGVHLPQFPQQGVEEGAKVPIQELFEVALLQKLLEKSPKKLVSRYDQLLELVGQVLEADGRAPLTDDIVGVVLSLLNLVITAPNFKKTDIKHEQLEIIESSLARLGDEDRPQISQTASNLSLLLKYRSDLDEDDKVTPVLSSRQIEDRRTYNLAMSYITGADSPPPVVSEGLNLISSLILSGSSTLDVTAVNVLMGRLLAENEDYINLRVIKIFTQLAGRHPRSTTKELLDHYLDAQEKLSTDTRLRFGEALLQVIERLGETFTGDVAQQTIETLLSIAGRRGYRPKTLAKTERAKRLREMKKRKGDDEDEDEELDDVEDMTEEEKATNEILTQIVEGWDSKRGAEDIRMRTSALSIFGTALETNIGGIGPTLASGGVDLCINILTMEPEIEKGILRRAAVISVLSFVRALQKAKEHGRSLGFGLTDSSREDISRTLQYIAGSDNDGLVQHHANDVVESLENWHMANLFPAQGAETPGLGSLAGLTVNPQESIMDGSGRLRPRIEEIE